VSYTSIAAAAVLCAVAIDVVALRTRLAARRAFWVSYAIVLGFQLMMNGVLTGLPVVRYSRHAILGPRIAGAPIEDIGFGFAMVLVTLSVWVRLGRRGGDQRRSERSAASSRPTASARRPSPTDTRRSSTW
jgi:lycopene cyclase domain-containing protein